jgi:hypothetical protein
LAKKKKIEQPARVLTRRQKSLHHKQQRRQRIIFISGVSVIAAIILIIIIGWIIGEYRPMHEDVVKVNDVDFNTQYLIDFMKIIHANQPDLDVSQMVDQSVGQIIRNELLRQGAAGFGITVNDEGFKRFLQSEGLPDSDAARSIALGYLLPDRLKSEVFDSKVPVSDNQVHILAMFVEGEKLAKDVRDQIVSTGNFTGLAAEYGLDYYSKNVNSGDFGWHPRSILEDRISSSIPLDYAFSAEVGTLSEPLLDEEMNKQQGYWLINVLERPDETQTRVNAILLSSRELAEDIRPRLAAGDNLTTIADEYTQYSPSKEKHGELGLLLREKAEEGEEWETSVSEDFDAYAFSENFTIGVWSEPVLETTLWTKGGCWLVKVVGREDKRDLTEEDRDILIENAYNQWVTEFQTMSSATIGAPGLTDKIREMVIEKVSKQ